MKRHAAKRHPKHIRAILRRLAAAGVFDVTVEVGRRYLLSWSVGVERMRIAAALTASSNAVDGIWAAIRALFRARGLQVPA